MTAREKPHSGRAGVPFINTTRGLASTADWILERVSVERRRLQAGVRVKERRAEWVIEFARLEAAVNIANVAGDREVVAD